MKITPNEILEFWFSDRVKKMWFSSTSEFDKEIRVKYEELWNSALNSKLESWKKTPVGSLALVIILDQFPLNMFRNQAKSFSTEKMALNVARNAINGEQDKEIEIEKVQFLYMPYMHSEDTSDQNMSVKLYREANLVENTKFAEHHRDIVMKYGRFPHRNSILARESTEEELVYLASKNAYLG